LSVNAFSQLPVAELLMKTQNQTETVDSPNQLMLLDL